MATYCVTAPGFTQCSIEVRPGSSVSIELDEDSSSRMYGWRGLLVDGIFYPLIQEKHYKYSERHISSLVEVFNSVLVLAVVEEERPDMYAPVVYTALRHRYCYDAQLGDDLVVDGDEVIIRRRGGDGSVSISRVPFCSADVANEFAIVARRVIGVLWEYREPVWVKGGDGTYSALVLKTHFRIFRRGSKWFVLRDGFEFAFSYKSLRAAKADVINWAKPSDGGNPVSIRFDGLFSVSRDIVRVGWDGVRGFFGGAREHFVFALEEPSPAPAPEEPSPAPAPEEPSPAPAPEEPSPAPAPEEPEPASSVAKGLRAGEWVVIDDDDKPLCIRLYTEFVAGEYVVPLMRRGPSGSVVLILLPSSGLNHWLLSGGIVVVLCSGGYTSSIFDARGISRSLSRKDASMLLDLFGAFVEEYEDIPF